MNKYSNLAKNTVIFAIGSFGSKILSFIIVPLYTYVLSTSEYGTIDLYTTALSLMIPFSTLVIYEGIIRYLTTDDISKKQAVTSGFLVFVIGLCACIVGLPLYSNIIGASEYIWIFVATLIFNSYNQIFSNYLRANNQTVAYSINGILITTTTVSLNLLFLVVFRMGINGYLYSLLISQLIACVQSTIQGHIVQNIDFKSLSKQVLITLLKYSIPLIPNGLMWWVMNAGDKYIINYCLGASFNGIYALSMKIPTILNLVYSIFMQAWQLSAIEEGEKKDAKDFYTNIFSLTMAILSIFSSIIILLIKPLFSIVIQASFVDAWKYIPLLCVAGIISCVATFTGVVYMVKEKSYKSFVTTLLGATVNLFLNWILINHLGLYGVAIGTGIGYSVVAFIRMKDVKKAVGMNLKLNKIIPSIIVIIVEGIIIINVNSVTGYVLGVVLFCVVITLYCKEIRLFLKYIRKESFNRRGF